MLAVPVYIASDCNTVSLAERDVLVTINGCSGRGIEILPGLKAEDS